jgi:general stress protein 26
LPYEKKKNTDIDSQHRETKWTIFTYSGKETRKMTKLFKDMQIKIAFRMQNTIQNVVKHHP